MVRDKKWVVVAAILVAALGYGLWAVSRHTTVETVNTANNAQATAAAAYTTAFNTFFRSSTVSSRTLVDATFYAAPLTAALKALPVKSDQQDEIARKLAELNGDQKRLAFVVTYSVPSGALPDDAVVEAATLSDDQDRSYPLFASQRIYSGTTTPAQVAPLLQHSYLLVFDTPGQDVAPQSLTLVVPAGDTTPRTLSWDLVALAL